MRRSMRSGSAWGGPAGWRIDASTPVAWVSREASLRPSSSSPSSATAGRTATSAETMMRNARMLLGLGRRFRPLGDDRFLELDGRAILELGGEAALLVGFDVHLGLLA